MIPLDQGVTSNSKAWAYSVEHIGIELVAGRLIRGELEGQIVLPLSSTDLVEIEQTEQEKKANTKQKYKTENSRLRYKGVISEDEYLLSVKLENALDFDALGAKIELYRNSSVELSVKNKRFDARAVLNGRMAITKNQKDSFKNRKEDGSLVNFKGIEFNNMVFQTYSPVFSVDYFGYKDKVELGNFPVSIADIALETNGESRAELAFDLKVNLMKGKISGGTRLAIKMEGYEKDFKQRWSFDGLVIRGIEIKGNFNAVEFEGKIHAFNNDPVYGRGFSGSVSITVLSTGLGIEGKAVFARTGHRYWFVDFLATLPQPIPIFPPLSITGIGGGVSYGMVMNAYNPNALGGLGSASSGLEYIPDQTAGIGFRAMTALGISTLSSFKGKASLGVSFNRNGGIRKIDFFGYAELMANGSLSINLEIDLKKTIQLPEFLDKKGNQHNLKATLLSKELELGGVKGDLSLAYDFQNKTLHGESNFYVNVLGGTIKGIGSEGRAGWAVLHFSPQDWYLYLGTPKDPIGISVGVGPIRAKARGYFMLGTRIPGSPPPPPIVAEILGVDAAELDYMRDLNALGEGSGFAFGLNFSVDTGDLNFLILYARFQTGAGFDIMLKDYGDARCKGRSGTIGINGWYANGQAYAYLQGELGIKIKLFFVNKKIPIIRAGSAVLLQAQAPDPLWLRGYLGGHYNLLGGLIKGKFRFKLTIGEQCELVNASPLGGIKIITGLTPRNGSSNTDVFTIPQAAFTMRVGEELIIPEDDGDKAYKIVLEKYQILDQGKEISGIIEWNSTKDRANFVSDDILPPNKDLTVQVQVSFQEKIGGVFRTIHVDGKKAVEVEKRTFKTGKAPRVIPLSNIVYAYPVLNQRFFLEDEYKTAYVNLKRGQDYLFETGKWKSTIVYTDENGNESEVAFNYDQAKNQVYTNYPDLKQQKSYSMAIVSSPTSQSKGVSDSDYIEESDDDQNTVQIKSKKAEELIKKGGIQRLAYEFTTSKYKTFRQKARAISPRHYDWSRVFSDVISLSVQTRPHEGFDLAELTGNRYTNQVPLVEVKALLDDDYYLRDIRPNIYSSYPFANKFYFIRDINQYGVPPSKALPVLTYYLTSLQEEVDRSWRKITFPYRYDLPYTYKKDLVDLKSQVSNACVNGGVSCSNDTALEILNVRFKFIRYGRYNINMQYVLPGGHKGSLNQFHYKNNIR